MATVSKLLGQLRDAAQTLRGEIGAIDNEIAALNDERRQLNNEPLTKADFAEYVKADIARQAQQYQNRLNREFSMASHARFVSLERKQQDGQPLGLPYLSGEMFAHGAKPEPHALYWLFGEQIAERFVAALDSQPWPETATPIAQRRERIAVIDARLAGLNTQRDALASEMMKAGLKG